MLYTISLPLEILTHCHCTQHNHQNNSQYIFQYQNTKNQAGKPLLPQSQIIKSLIDNSRGGHGQHTSQIQTVHALPPERPPYKNPNQYHTKI